MKKKTNTGRESEIYSLNETNSFQSFLDKSIIFLTSIERKKRTQGCDKLRIFSHLISI